MKKNLTKISEPGKSKLQSLSGLAAFMLTRAGLKVLKNASKKSLQRAGIIKEKEIDYNEWINSLQSVKEQDAVRYLLSLNRLPKTPTVSILMPVHSNTQAAQLETVIKSILNQAYGEWRLAITFDPAVNAGVKQLLQNYNKTEQRIHATEGNTNSLFGYLDDSFIRFAGDYILIMDSRYTLSPVSLFAFITYAMLNDNAIVYCDEDEIDDKGKYTNPNFKPGWSREYFLTHNYIGDVFLVETLFLQRLLAIIPSLKTGAQTPYDMLLLAKELTNRFRHIPKVLLHKRAATVCADEFLSIKKSIAHDLSYREHIKATVADIPGVAGKYQVNYELPEKKKVSIIIPTKDHTTILKRAIDSILEKTDYPDYEIVIVNNNSTDPAFFRLVQDYKEQHPGMFICLDANFPFNFSKLINLGASVSNGRYLLMLNNDVEVISSDWLTQMAACIWTGAATAIGPKLLYPDDTIQHAGIVLGGDDGAYHVFAHKHRGDNGYNDRLKTVNNYSALTGACLMCDKGMFEWVGGMNEDYVVEYSDFDLCLRLLEAGFGNAYLPQVELYHHESATRGHPFRNKEAWRQHQEDLAIFKQKWQPLIDDDPFYNPNLRLKFKGMSLE